MLQDLINKAVEFKLALPFEIKQFLGEGGEEDDDF